MNSYLFNAWLVEISPLIIRGKSGDRKILSPFDRFENLIVNAENEESARNILNDYLTKIHASNSVHSRQIRKIFCAPILNNIFTEEGPMPLDWEKVSQQMLNLPDTQSHDPGYWLDVNDLVKPNLNFGSFFRSIPDDLRRGLNWTDDKQFVFLLNVLSREDPQMTDKPLAGLDLEEPTLEELRAQQAICPQLGQKELVVVIRARNSAVAGWLWRNHAVSTPLAANAIRTDPIFSGPVQIPTQEA